MKTYCKRIDPSDMSIIKRYTWEALQPKLKRKDYSEFTAQYCDMSGKEIRKLAREREPLNDETEKALNRISAEISERIRTKDLKLDPILYTTRTDGLSKKTRTIGIESVMQQLMEHVAVGCMDELWKAKYEQHQYASIKGRGQLAGAKTIQRWVKAGKITYFVKLDVKKCFQSLNRDISMVWLRRDIGKNKALLWFTDALLSMHQDGLVIGSLLSQFLCNYFMSYAYRYVMGLHKVRRARKVQLCGCALFYMDDILLAGTDRRNLLMAARKLTSYMRDSFGLTIKPSWNIRKISDCGIDMMGYVITEKGRIKIRPRVFIRARRAFARSAHGDNRPKIQRRVSAYYGYMKAANVKRLNLPEGLSVSVHDIQRKAAILTSNETRREHHAKNQ